MDFKETVKMGGKTISEIKEKMQNSATSNPNDFEILFPYDTVRPVQAELMKDILSAIIKKRNIIAHAPTGLGKTVAALAPAISYAIKNNKKVLFLTSRHTQHNIAIDTLKDIKTRHHTSIKTVDIIGKKWMCNVENVEDMYSSEFTDFCKSQREAETCEFFNNTKRGGQLTIEAKSAISELKNISPCHLEEFRKVCETEKVCTYEIAAAMAKDADVIVADYYYLFNEKIRDAFFKRAGITMSNCIAIVDEGHNLPDRIRSLMTTQLTNNMIKRAIKEAKKINQTELMVQLVDLQDILLHFSKGLPDGGEILIRQEQFESEIDEKIGDYDDFMSEIEFAGTLVRDNEKQSSLASIARFLSDWKGASQGFTRFISFKEAPRGSIISLTYRCLDPGISTGDTILNCHSVILMSGTLEPTHMYRDLLDFNEEYTIEKSYASPFSGSNRLNLIIPETTTKFSERSEKQYERMAEIINDITLNVSGNSAIFFPSYFLRDQVYGYFKGLTNHPTFLEKSNMTKEEKNDFLQDFKDQQKKGSVLLGVISGNFAEGIDLPGDLLKCVVVVGLPLQKPNLETNMIIKYYDMKFQRGWDYGYVFPAFQKTLQSAGRCIRSETDRGVIVFLDERYAWENYIGNFPKDWDMVVSKDYVERIKGFFGKQ